MKPKSLISRTWAQMILISFLALTSGLAVNWWRPLSLPWVFNAEGKAFEAAKRSANGSGPAEVDLDQMLEALSRDDITIIDAREEAFYRFGHIPGAINMPPNRLERDLPGLLNAIPSQNEIIVYCGDRFCPMAENLIIQAASNNRPAKLFPLGYIGWEKAGHKIEVSP